MRLDGEAMDAKTAGQHSVHSSTDNCYRDYATRNAAALADLLAAEGADTVAAQGHWP